ncbi:fluoride efflux transporter CrcB [Pseudaminobacter salicylatoxidans]|uniref:fluoride efflux transporter CrcB n=1 Tax=Pseudaminobacter salicylatoxidans TaxID=93369 RepID=UPI000316408D|nr:fluoride efflux transporter CrcB [Pseudaminobacter salicylatoxidans]
MEQLVESLLWVALGSALGGPARFFISGVVGRRIGETFPWGTMTVNVTGAFVIGLIGALATGGGLFATPETWQLAVTGFLGAYTTVSSFSLQTLMLVRDGEILLAGGNIVLSLVLGLGFVTLGYMAGTAIAGVPI